MERLKDFFGDKQVDTLLDVGTGTGDFIAVLKEVFPRVSITGVDPNGEALKEAGEKYPDVEFRRMGAEKLGFPDNSFDVVSISMALHHLPDITGAFSEMKRVVKPGGWIIVNELFSDNLNKAQEVHKMYHHFRSTIDRILGVSHNHTFRKQEILDIVGQSGIEILDHFEFRKKGNQISSEADLAERVEKMNSMLEQIKNHPEYDKLKPQVDVFADQARKYGFETATRVVVIGQV